MDACSCSGGRLLRVSRPSMVIRSMPKPFLQLFTYNHCFSTSRLPYIHGSFSIASNGTKNTPLAVVNEPAFGDEVQNSVEDDIIHEDNDLEDDLIHDDDLEDDLIHDDNDLEDGALMEENFVEDGRQSRELEVYAGDGGDGGGVVLTEVWWAKEAYAIAEKVCMSFDGDFKIYAFKTLGSMIQVRIEKMSDEMGCPSMSDIDAFSSSYRERLTKAERAGSIGKDITLEVSSPGAERFLRVPEDLDRFKEQPMFVKYRTEEPSDQNGVFRIISVDVEGGSCVWGLADVKVNRVIVGKQSRLTRKQKNWRLNTTFSSIRYVRLYLEL